MLILDPQQVAMSFMRLPVRSQGCWPTEAVHDKVGQNRRSIIDHLGIHQEFGVRNEVQREFTKRMMVVGGSLVGYGVAASSPGSVSEL